MLLRAALGELAGMGKHLVVDVEVLVGVETKNLLGCRNFLLTEGRAMNTAGVHLVRCWVADDGLDADEGRAGSLCAGSFSCCFECLDILTGLNRLHVPAVSLVALHDVLVECDVRVVLDGDTVVIPEHDEVAQLLSACQGGSFSGHALLQVTIGRDDVDKVIKGGFAGGCGSVEKPAFFPCRHGHTDGGSQALAQRTSGDLHAIGVVNLRVARGLRTPGAQRLEVFHLKAESAQEKLNVLG